MTNFSDASWRRRPEDPTDFELYSPANILRERARNNLQVYTWGTLIACGIACGFFITGWKVLLGVVGFAVVVSFLFAWIAIKRGR